jgi:hypothetical protein
LHIAQKGIASITVRGDSIAMLLNEYLQQRTQNITFATKASLADESPTSDVILTTLSMPHVLWHRRLAKAARMFNRLPNSTDTERRYHLSGFYYSSEREPHVLAERSLQFSEIAEKILVAKGYHTAWMLLIWQLLLRLIWHHKWMACILLVRPWGWWLSNFFTISVCNGSSKARKYIKWWEQEHSRKEGKTTS